MPQHPAMSPSRSGYNCSLLPLGLNVQEPLDSRRYGVKESVCLVGRSASGKRNRGSYFGLLPINIGSGAGAAGV